MPVRLAVTAGTVADCSQALPLIEGIKAEHLLADKAYDTNEIVAGASATGDESGDTAQEQPEGKAGLRPGAVQVAAFGGERFPGRSSSGGDLATRYAKNSLSYLAICQIRAMAIWTKLL